MRRRILILSITIVLFVVRDPLSALAGSHFAATPGGGSGNPVTGYGSPISDTPPRGGPTRR